MFVFLVFTLLSGASATSNVTIEDIPDAYLNLASGNSLWTALVKNCRPPTMACVEKNMYDYLKTTLEYPDDVHVTPFVKFIRNRMDYKDVAGDAVSEDDVDESADDEPRSSIEEMSRSLHGTGVKFLMTHDMEVELPETMFEGSTLKVSPRGFEGNGALVHIEVLPKAVPTGVAEARLFKKIKNFISEKLVYALMAILLVIKLLAAKFMFFLPMMVGAVTAKKLLVKVLLFLFPALHHLFKFCAYVPHGHKFHYHKHHIQHLHHIAKPHKHHHHGHHDSVEVIRPHSAGPPDSDGDWHSSSHHHHHHGPDFHGPSTLHHGIEIEEPYKPLYNPDEENFDFYHGKHGAHGHGRPDLKLQLQKFIDSRQDATDDNEVQPWGQGQRKKPPSKRPLTPTEIEAMVLKAEKEAQLKARLQQERLRIHDENARLQEQLRLAMKIQEKLKQQAAMVKAKLPVPPSNFLQAPATEVKQVYSAKVKQEDVQAKLQSTSPSPSPSPSQTQKSVQTAFHKALQQAASITYDPFYSPILDKIDKILIGLGFLDEPCRERLICSMYKNPPKFSPHSNLLSAELSRDSSELQKPTATNAAVIRFYRYVQAARDGQDKRECLRLYPACSINTEQ